MAEPARPRADDGDALEQVGSSSFGIPGTSREVYWDASGGAREDLPW